MTSFDPAPRTLDAVTTPDWLSAALAPHLGGAKVTSVETVELLATQATKVRLALGFDHDDSALPAAICIKGVLTDTGAPAAASITETRFYQNMAATLPIHVPDCLYAGLTEAGDNGVIVMRDVKAAGGTFLSALSPVTADEAAETVGQIALLHAAAWQGSPLYDTPWVPRFLDMIAPRGILPLDTLQQLMDGPRGVPLPAVVKDAVRLQAALGLLSAQGQTEPNCLVHGDTHAGNIYRDAGGVGIIDWQVFQKGEWALDVAYHIAAVLSPEDRRTHERALLDSYRTALKAAGGPDLDAEHSWRRYRIALLYGYYMWAITRKVDADITNEFNRRLGLAVADHDSFTLIES